MMNMFQLQERIKDFSKDQLVREMQQPSGAVPQFLVLSELQRRSRMEKAFQADQAQGQQSTVAQDAIAAAGVPQGGIADMARAMAPQTDMTQNTGIAPVERMQEGGRVEGPNTARLRQIMEIYRGLGDVRRDFEVQAARAARANRLTDVDQDVSAFRPTPAPRDTVRPRGFSPQMTLPALASLDPLSTAAPVDVAVTGDPTAAPRLVTRDGQQFAEMPDDSLIPLGDLGVSPALLAGADTPDLTARPGFRGRDLAAERMGEGFDTVSGLGAPILSSADRISIDPELAMGAPRVAPVLGLPDRESAPTADILRPPSVEYIETMTDALPAEELPSGYALSRLLFPGEDPEQTMRRLSELEDSYVASPTVALDEFSGLPTDMVPEGSRDVTPGRARRYTPEPAPVPMSAQPDLLEDMATPTAPPRAQRQTPGGGAGGAGARATGTADADKWLALAQFGLGLMASQQPTLGGAIGEAGTMALGQLRESQREAYERDLAERTLAARTAGAGRGSQFPAAGANLLNSQIEALVERMADPLVTRDPALRDNLQSQLDTLLAQQRLLQAAYLSQYGLAGALGASAPAEDLSTVRANISDE